MTGKQTASLTPAAGFVVKREPGKGYHVASADGPCADDFKARALTLLDTLGQPDPKGPEEYFRWVGPITPSGEYVGVFVRLMPNGEARYHQAWFRVPKPAMHSGRTISSLILVVLGFVAGVFAGPTLSSLDPWRTSGSAPGRTEAPPNSQPVPPMNGSWPDDRMTNLINEIASARDVRLKLKQYLSQEGLAADLSQPVVDEKRSVKLIADLDRTPPPVESIRLSNVEVAKLIRLLEVIDELAAFPNP